MFGCQILFMVPLLWIQQRAALGLGMCKKYGTAFRVLVVFLFAMVVGGCSSEPGGEYSEDRDGSEIDASWQDSGGSDVEKDTGQTADLCAEVECGVNAQCVQASGQCVCKDGFAGNPQVGEQETPKLDILWMIDNSGSMCQEQKALRENFGVFIENLAKNDLDFHIGITTTHYTKTNTFFEPVAVSGHLQVTPQPLPGFDASCFYPADANGNPVHSAAMEPILDAIKTAVSCTKDPNAYIALLTPDMDRMRCAFDSTRWRTTLDCTDMPAKESFFPDPADYRDVAQGRKYLRSEDYRKVDNTLDVERLQADFACASLVGTRGNGVEKGLLAVVQAVSPELTGGPDGDPAEFPNAGFLRPDARTSIIIVSDENDCSHDGTLSETHSCGSSLCEMAENWDPSPLIPVEQLKNELVENLASSKGVALVSTEDVLVASIHGTYQPYLESGLTPDGDLNECAPGEQNVPPSCSSHKGVAYSGHRYDAFMRQFESMYPPIPGSDPEAAVAGLICEDFSPAFVDIANMFRVKSEGCAAQ